MAYENLPDTIKQRIDGLYAKHSSEHTFGAQTPIEERHAMAAKNPAAEHPVVLTHPETGEKVLFVNSTFTTHFSDFFNFEDIRYGQDFMPEAHHLMNYLPESRTAATASTQPTSALRPNSATTSASKAEPPFAPSPARAKPPTAIRDHNVRANA
jgi:hypothetical protein